MKKLTLKNIFKESKETSPFASKTVKEKGTEKEEILKDEKKCMCAVSPCDCKVDESFSTGCPSKLTENEPVVEAPKVSGGGSEFEYDPHMENHSEMDSLENEFEVSDDFDFSNLEAEEDEFALDDPELGLDKNIRSQRNDDEGFRQHDFDLGRFVDPEDF